MRSENAPEAGPETVSDSGQTQAGSANATVADTPEMSEARNIALRYLTGAARSTEQVRQRLRSKQVAEPVIEELVTRFTRVNLLDDSDFAIRWVENRSRLKALGAEQLRQELKQKGVAPHVIENALEGLDSQDTFQLAYELVLRRIPPAAQLDDFATKEKIKRRMVNLVMRKGHPLSFALNVVDQALAEKSASESL